MKRAIAAICAGSSILSGCATLGRSARVDPVSIAAQGVDQNCKNVANLDGDSAFAINLDCYHFPREDKVSVPRVYDTDIAKKIEYDEKIEKAYTAYRLANVERHYRNRLEAVLLRQADTVCEREKGMIFANESAVNTVFDFLASGLSTASTIAGGEQAKSILSGLAGLSTAGKSHVTANVYKNQIVPAITNIIDSERKRILTEIISKRGEEVSAYPADEMIRQANSYHQACSFQNGLQVLLKASVNKAGNDAIIRSMNLQFAIQKLKTELAAAKVPAQPGAALSAEATESAKQYEEKIRQLTLEQAVNAQTIQGEANTVTEPTSP